jgi:mono/diheme cytochrome c family protein
MSPWLLAGAAVFLLAPAPSPSQRRGEAARGRELYDRHCAACHGPVGAGDGPVAASMVRSVPDLRGMVDESREDAQVDIILRGQNAMPGYSSSFDRYDARRVWRHLRGLTEGTIAAEEPPAAEEPDEPEGDAP